MRPQPRASTAEDLWAGLATQSYPIAGFRELKLFHRRTGRGSSSTCASGGEWRAGPHRGCAIHIPLHELPDRLDDVPAGRVWVHWCCGYRASVAGSLLARAGRTVMVVSDQFANAVDAGSTSSSACD